LEFLMVLIYNLTKFGDNSFQPNIVAVANPFTISFANIVKHLPDTRVHLCSTNQETIEKYTQIFNESEPITLEITKPSEQTYKALLTPTQNGGVILLLTAPIGKQEEDNLEFLQRHHLVPSQEQCQLLVGLSNLSSNEKEILLKQATKWRAVILPDNPQEAVKFIYNLKINNVFTQMQKYKRPKINELSDKGVVQFWESIS